MCYRFSVNKMCVLKMLWHVQSCSACMCVCAASGVCLPNAQTVSFHTFPILSITPNFHCSQLLQAFINLRYPPPALVYFVPFLLFRFPFLIPFMSLDF